MLSRPGSTLSNYGCIQTHTDHAVEQALRNDVGAHGRIADLGHFVGATVPAYSLKDDAAVSQSQSRGHEESSGAELHSATETRASPWCKLQWPARYFVNGGLYARSIVLVRGTVLAVSQTYWASDLLYTANIVRCGDIHRW